MLPRRTLLGSADRVVSTGHARMADSGVYLSPLKKMKNAEQTAHYLLFNLVISTTTFRVWCGNNTPVS